MRHPALLLLVIMLICLTPGNGQCQSSSSHKPLYDGSGILLPSSSWSEAIEREMNRYQLCPRKMRTRARFTSSTPSQPSGVGQVNAKRRLLIIGTRGFVGAHFARLVRPCLGVLDDSGIDVTNAATVRASFDRERPDIVALLAAISDIDQCERKRDLAEAVNVHGVENVVSECVRTGARLIFSSSAAVFDGTQHGYGEEDHPHPLSFYGETKARAEALIGEALPPAIILRMSLVLGFGLLPGTNSLIDKLAGNFRAGRPVAVPTEEHRNPIDVGTLCQFLLELALLDDARGFFHIGAAGSMSRYELATKLAERMGYSRALVVPQQEQPAERADRGRDHFLLTDKIRRICRTPVPTCEEVIERCLHATA